MNNLITLHEAISIALLSNMDRKLTFKDIADFINQRNLYPNRKGNITLEKQIMYVRLKAAANMPTCLNA